MPASLRQLNVTYMESEDRLLLKISTSDDQEYRLWCTRRYTRILMEQLEGMFQKEVDEEESVPAAARKEVAAFKHSDSVKEESFKQPYEAEPQSYPLGEEGMLVTTLRYKVLETGAVAMTLCNKDNKGLNFNLDKNLRHQLYELLSRAVKKADWFETLPSEAPALVH